MMNENEKKLLISLCRFQDKAFDEDLLRYATPYVLGHLFFNRMQGVAYGTLKKHNLLGKINREFRNSLEAAYKQNIEKNKSFFWCTKLLSRLLAHSECRVAMLKGAFLCKHYPSGYRTASDIDLLVSSQDVTSVGELLAATGFKQGHIRNGEFIPATRKEIIISRMLRGEVVPYIKKVNLPWMKYLEVDINFSLDYKHDNSNLVDAMLERVHVEEQNGIAIPTLGKEEFFIHLCAHLYKEATTLPWIEMRRDMTLYKYCDIYFLLSEMTSEEKKCLFIRASELGMEKICAYAILETAGLFDMPDDEAIGKAKQILKADPSFILRVTSPKEKKTMLYRIGNVKDRFFSKNRIRNLKEYFDEET